MGTSAIAMFGGTQAAAAALQQSAYAQTHALQADLWRNSRPDYANNALQNAYRPLRTIDTVRNTRGETLAEWNAAYARLGGGRTPDERLTFMQERMEWETYAYELEIMAEAEGPRGDRTRLIEYGKAIGKLPADLQA